MVLSRTFWWLVLMSLSMLVSHKALAEQVSLFQQASLLSARSPLFDGAGGSGDSSGSASLFVGQQGASFFAPFAPRNRHKEGDGLLRRGGTQVDQLLELISHAEAGSKGYDAVQHGARRKPSKRPTQMTIHEIYLWIKQTPGQPHAIGRYQFIPATLKRLVTAQGVSQSAVFSPAIQDQLAQQLLVEAGMNKFLGGQITRKTFMNNLAKVWAGLPTSSGKSYYDGYAGNKATMSWSYYQREMVKIFPG